MKSVNFWWHFHLLKNNILCKSVSFWANEWISKYIDKIMSCKLWGKVTSVSVNINFGARMSLFYEKNWNFGRNVDFFIKCALLLKVIIFLPYMLIFRKMWLIVWRFIYINKVSNSEKNIQFLRYVRFVYVLIFIKVFNLLENCYFDSKYHLVQRYFGQVSFS